ncbi:N-acetylmuramoyl-L-alanine amidase [Rhodococcus sp. NPDC127528]|uniref:peptidoglycan recognition protein family protein n=1 Tax=unclassified Rhodococcus (in: high G+C Gram-positive bacteria) TaxID=192944 RepID=UPI00362CEB24
MDQYPVDQTLLTEADSGVRPTTQFLAIHTSEGALTIESLLAWCADKNRGASYNTMIDRQGRTGRCNDDQYAPWAAGWTGNARGWHVCLLGFAAQSRGEWLSYTGQLDRLADMLAFYCRKYQIPAVWLTAADVRAGKRGICGHAEISEAWREVNHTDPGPNFPKDVLIAKVAAKLAPQPTAPKQGGSDMDALTAAEQRELLVKTREIWEQLRGPGGRGWEQLGKTSDGHNLTLVDSLARHTAGGSK